MSYSDRRHKKAIYGWNTLGCRKTSKKNARYYSRDYFVCAANSSILIQVYDLGVDLGWASRIVLSKKDLAFFSAVTLRLPDHTNPFNKN